MKEPRSQSPLYLLTALSLIGAAVATFLFIQERAAHQQTLGILAAKETFLASTISDHPPKEVDPSLLQAPTDSPPASPTPMTDSIQDEAQRSEVPSPAPADVAGASLQQERVDSMVEFRLRALGKFIPLNDEQRARLEQKFRADLDPNLRSSGESLEEILGKENFEFYQSERKKAFERAEEEAREKEVLYLSRRLALTPPQEDQLRTAYREVEKEVSRQIDDLFKKGGTPRSRQLFLQRVLTENQLRATLLAEQARAILSSPQYEQYIEIQANSSESDLEVWHGP